MKYKANFLLVNVIFFLNFVAVFILNNNRKEDVNLIILNSILSVFTLVYIFTIPMFMKYLKKNKVNKVDLFLIFAVFIAFVACLLVRKIVVVHWVYLVIFYFVLHSDFNNLSKKLTRMMIFLSVVSILIQLMIFDLDGRAVLSYIDPNYSGMVIFFLGSFIFYSYSKKLAFMVFAVGLVTLSRNYLLAISIFYLSHYLVNIRFFRSSMLFITKPLITLLIICILPLIVNFWFVANYTNDTVVHNTVETKTSGSIVDASNLHRSMANVLFIKDLGSNPTRYMFGADTDWYLDKIFMNSPHHGVFQLILNYGYLFTIPYLLFFFRQLNRTCINNPTYLPFYMGFFSFMMVLGGGVNGVYIIIIAFIMISARYNTLKNPKY